MRNLKAVIFDLDGTLVNSLGDLAVAYNYALKEHGLKQHEEKNYAYFVGDGSLKCAERACGENPELAQKVKDTAIEYYSKNYDKFSECYEGVFDAVEVLISRGIKLAVLSNKPDDVCRDVIASFFPKNTFEIVRGLREGEIPKPDTANVEKILEQLDVDAKSTIFVGDSAADMKVAVEAGLTPVGVEWGFRGVDELKDNGAEIILEDTADISSLPEIFENLED